MSETTNTQTATNNTDAAAKPVETVTTDIPKEVLSDAANSTQAKPTSTEPAAPVVPEKYELKPSEGSLLKNEQLAEIEKYAKANKLTQEQATQLLAKEEGLLNGYVESMRSAHDGRVEAWKKTASEDKEIGGAEFAKHTEFAKRSLDQFATPDFKQMLDATGFGNHPEVIRVFARIGKAMSDDSIFKPNTNTPAKGKSLAERMYGPKT